MQTKVLHKYQTAKESSGNIRTLTCCSNWGKSISDNSLKNITLSLPSIGDSHYTCCVCKKRGPKLIVVSSKARINVFMYKNVIIAYGLKCSQVHIADDMITEEAVNMMNNFRQNTNFNRTDIMNLICKTWGAAEER